MTNSPKPSPDYRTSKDGPWPTTIWRACPTPTSPPFSAALPTPRDALPPTASPHSDAPTQGRPPVIDDDLAGDLTRSTATNDTDLNALHARLAAAAPRDG